MGNNTVRAVLRPAETRDRGIIRKMFYEAIYIPPGEQRPDFSIVDDIQLRKYTWDWMKEGDEGFIAEVDGSPVGAAWVRLISPQDPGYGFISPDIPELSMAVLPPWRGQGIGSSLLQELLNQLCAAGYAQVSLSVDRRNRAVKLYQEFGFTVHEARKDDFVMLLSLQ